jgi:hypothetical protein
MKQTEYRPFSNLYTVCCCIKEVDLVVVRVKPEDHGNMIYMLSYICLIPKVELVMPRVILAPMCFPRKSRMSPISAVFMKDFSSI